MNFSRFEDRWIKDRVICTTRLSDMSCWNYFPCPWAGWKLVVAFFGLYIIDYIQFPSQTESWWQYFIGVFVSLVRKYYMRCNVIFKWAANVFMWHWGTLLIMRGFRVQAVLVKDAFSQPQTCTCGNGMK